MQDNKFPLVVHIDCNTSEQREEIVKSMQQLFPAATLSTVPVASPLLQEAAEWVSIADNLHENITVQTNDCTIDVLVRTDNADSPIAVAFYNKKRKEWWLSEKDDVELTPTHWMKLPALPAPPKPNNE